MVKHASQSVKSAVERAQVSKPAIVWSEGKSITFSPRKIIAINAISAFLTFLPLVSLSQSKHTANPAMTSSKSILATEMVLQKKEGYQDDAARLYNKLSPSLGRLSQSSFFEAFCAYKNGVASGKIKSGKFIIVDLSQRSSFNRFYVVDFESMKLIAAVKTAHGYGNGDDAYADSTSNIVNSGAMPPGLLRISGPGMGVLEGWALEGLEPRNCNTAKRAILIHSWACTPTAKDSSTVGPTAGCMGINSSEAMKYNFPQHRKDMTFEIRKDWKWRGVYVCFKKN